MATKKSNQLILSGCFKIYPVNIIRNLIDISLLKPDSDVLLKKIFIVNIRNLHLITRWH